jgi:two-component sensor histidine kinase
MPARLAATNALKYGALSAPAGRVSIKGKTGSMEAERSGSFGGRPEDRQ